MARIDEPRRLNVDEFPKESRQTIEMLAEYYNYAIEQITNAINGNIDYDNTKNKLITLEFTTSSIGVPIPKLQFSANVGLIGTKVIRVDNLSNPTVYPISSPFISYSTSGNGVYSVNDITGLRSSTKYRVVIELIYN